MRATQNICIYIYTNVEKKLLTITNSLIDNLRLLLIDNQSNWKH